MRLVSYGAPDAYRAGLWLDDGIADIEECMRLAKLDVAPVSDMRMLLEIPGWRGLLDKLAAVAGGARLDPEAVRLGPPVPQPRNLILAGANTHSHVAEAEPLLGKVNPPNRPMLIGKATTSVCGARDDIVLPPETRKLDYEVEVAVIIGKRARRISEAAVEEHIAGFCVSNDVSARDMQIAEHEEVMLYKLTHYLGKSFDTFCPMGPALVTADAVDWKKPLKMRTLVNGEVRQDGDTSDLVHSIAALVAYASQVMTLNPGDVILTGSPAGVANFMEPPAFLNDGDIVRCEIEGLGALENRVRKEAV